MKSCIKFHFFAGLDPRFVGQISGIFKKDQTEVAPNWWPDSRRPFRKFQKKPVARGAAEKNKDKFGSAPRSPRLRVR